MSPIQSQFIQQHQNMKQETTPLLSIIYSRIAFKVMSEYTSVAVVGVGEFGRSTIARVIILKEHELKVRGKLWER